MNQSAPTNKGNFSINSKKSFLNMAANQANLDSQRKIDEMVKGIFVDDCTAVPGFGNMHKLLIVCFDS